MCLVGGVKMIKIRKDVFGKYDSSVKKKSEKSCGLATLAKKTLFY